MINRAEVKEGLRQEVKEGVCKTCEGMRKAIKELSQKVNLYTMK